jgi:ABC-2 type transport system permease protein
MRGALLLLWHSIKRIRALIVAAAALLAAFQVVLILVAGSVQRSNSFSQMSAMIPPFAREMLGPSLAGLMSFSGIVCLGYFHLIVIGSLVALCISLGTTPTGEIEAGFMDLVLSRPVARHWVITRAVVLVTLSTAGLLGVMMFGTWFGLTVFAPADAAWPTRRLIGSLAANLGLLMLCWSGIAMAIGCASRRRGVAGAIAGLLAVATFLLDYVARLWKVAEPFGWLSPFRYFSPFELLMGASVPPRNLLVLAAAALTGFALSYVLFGRRDISH